MAIFSLDNIRKNKIRYSKYLNEIQVNGENINDDDDFTMDDEEDEDIGEETPQDTAQNAVENPDESTEQAAEELGATDTTAEDDIEAPAEGDDTDNFTMDDEDLSTIEDDTTDTADTTSNNTANEEDNFTLEDTDTSNDITAETNDNADNAAGTDDTSTNIEIEGDTNADQTADAGTTDDGASNDDFTMNDLNSGGEKTAEGDDTTGENTDEGGGDTDGAAAEDAPPANPTDNISDEDIKTSEEQIYDSLTDDQKRIRVLQLKIDYKDLYETIITTREGINSIPKTMENLDAIKRLILFVEKTKNILIDYIQNNFDKNPYLENYAMYIKFMSVFRTISKVIEDINNSKK